MYLIEVVNIRNNEPHTLPFSSTSFILDLVSFGSYTVPACFTVELSSVFFSMVCTSSWVISDYSHHMKYHKFIISEMPSCRLNFTLSLMPTCVLYGEWSHSKHLHIHEEKSHIILTDSRTLHPLKKTGLRDTFINCHHVNNHLDLQNSILWGPGT